jgi:hypothetical protein
MNLPVRIHSSCY